MKILSENDIKFLVESALLMPEKKGYEEVKLYPGKYASMAVSIKSVAGYPVLYKTDHILSDIFPFLECKDKSKEYLVPQGLNEILMDKEKGWLETQPLFRQKLKEWTELAKGYIASGPSRDNIAPFEKDLITSFRQAYAVYLYTNHACLTFSSDIILNLVSSGGEYRRILNDHMKEIYNSLPSRESIIKYISDNILDNHNDIISFEKAILNKKARSHQANIAGINISYAYLWNGIITEKYNEKYMGPSPILDVLREELYYAEEEKVNNIFSWLEVYDISLIKKDLLYFFNKSHNSDIIEYVKNRLEAYNELPDSSSVLLQQNIQTVSKNTILLDANSIRNHVNHNLFATETLIEIIITAFKQDEKDYSDIGKEINFHDGIIKVYIESQYTKTTQQLSENFLYYVQAAISEAFLSEDIVETLNNNLREREAHEQNTTIMDNYKKIKNSFLLHKQLQNDLPELTNKKRLNKI